MSKWIVYLPFRFNMTRAVVYFFSHVYLELFIFLLLIIMCSFSSQMLNIIIHIYIEFAIIMNR